jgi:macrophage erythroblast attacher
MAWKKIRCHRMMVDHFLREGHYATAITLSKTCDIEHLVDTGVFEVCQKVEDGLRNCVTGPCLAWCHDNRSKLRRLKSTLEYRIRLQDFTELVRQDRRMEAVK